MIQAHVIYEGNVQGVGFRWNAHRVAGGYDIKGYVKNLPDGTVELIAEGEAQTVDAFLVAVASRMSSHIYNANITKKQAVGAWPSFSIAY